MARCAGPRPARSAPSRYCHSPTTDELEGAEKAGFRTLVDLDYFQRLEDYPFMEGLRGEARFQQLLARIREDNLRMREDLARPATSP
jgi:hypothetical protein